MSIDFLYFFSIKPTLVNRLAVASCRPGWSKRPESANRGAREYCGSMVQAPPHSVAADFRDDPLIVALLRKAVAVVGTPLGDLDDASFDLLMESYRERNGERSATASFSVGKYQLDSHVSKFRSSFTKVLVDCLQSQLDRLQGREAFWPVLDSDSPDLVPDAVIERRLAIDDLTRQVDNDAPEGVKAFDVLLSRALGHPFKSLRDNPLRPAVFFHALGQCWTQASASDIDELLILGRIGPSIAERVAKLYPQMTAILRQALGVPKPNSLIMPSGDEREGPLYSRLRDVKLNPPIVAEQEQGASDMRRTPTTIPTMDRHETSSPAQEQVFRTLEQVTAFFDAALTEERLPKEVRLVLARMQIPLTRTALSDPTVFSNPKHPLRSLFRDLMNPAVWQRSVGQTKSGQGLLMHLGVILEMLKRERRDAARDGLLYEHLHTQFLGLISAPTPKVLHTSDTSSAKLPENQNATV